MNMRMNRRPRSQFVIHARARAPEETLFVQCCAVLVMSIKYMHTSDHMPNTCAHTPETLWNVISVVPSSLRGSFSVKLCVLMKSTWTYDKSICFWTVFPVLWRLAGALIGWLHMRKLGSHFIQIVMQFIPPRQRLSVYPRNTRAAGPAHTRVRIYKLVHIEHMSCWFASEFVCCSKRHTYTDDTNIVHFPIQSTGTTEPRVSGADYNRAKYM